MGEKLENLEHLGVPGVEYEFKGQWRTYPRNARAPKPSWKFHVRRFLLVTRIWWTGKGEGSVDAPAMHAVTQVYKWLGFAPLYLIFNDGRLVHVRRACPLWKEIEKAEASRMKKLRVENPLDWETPEEAESRAREEVREVYKGCRL